MDIYNLWYKLFALLHGDPRMAGVVNISPRAFGLNEANRHRNWPGIPDMDEVLEPELKDLLDYWDRMRGNKQMPARADIDPLNIPRLLPYLALIQTSESLGDFRYRLYGTDVCEGFGNDRTGVRLGDLKEDVDNYDEVYAGYWRVYEDRAPDYFHGKIVSLAKNYKKYSRLLLPLSSDDEHVNIILCGFLFFTSELDRGAR